MAAGRGSPPLRVVRFDEEPATEPERVAPVARFGEDTPDRARSTAGQTPTAGDDRAGACRPVGEAVPVGMFDDLDSPAAAPVASVEDLARPDRDTDVEGRTCDEGSDRAPAGRRMADIDGVDGASAPAARTVGLTGLTQRRRRAATPAPGERASRRSGSPQAVDPERPDPERPDPDPERSDPEPSDAPSGGGEPRWGTRSRRNSATGGPRGGGGFGRRGAPAELDPDADPIAVAREVCLRLLADRARTRQELAQALRRKGVPDEAAHTVLERFDEVGLIDDAAFAGQWVRSRHNQRGLARRAIAMELRRKGVDDEVAGEALEEVDQASEERRARELVDRKLRTVPADTPEQRKKAAPRLVGMLARKGYGGGIAYRVVREALAAHGAEIDELGTDSPD